MTGLRFISCTSGGYIELDNCASGCAATQVTSPTPVTILSVTNRNPVLFSVPQRVRWSVRNICKWHVRFHVVEQQQVLLHPPSATHPPKHLTLLFLSRVLNFYERSHCTANVTLPDIPPSASDDFKISSQFDAVGSVDPVAFQVLKIRRAFVLYLW